MADDNEELVRITELLDKDYFATDQQREWQNEDMRFCDIDGAMYDDWMKEQFQDRPMMEFNKTSQAVHKFNGEWRSNRFDTKFKPDDGSASDDDATLLGGMHRKSFRRSSGREAVDNAVTEAVKGGFGAWQLTTEFVDESDITNDNQRIMYEPIFSAYSSVIFDSNAKRYDKSDARHVTRLEQFTRHAAVEEWGDKVSSVFEPPNQRRFNWGNGAKVWIGHFYEIREKKEEVAIFEDPLGRRKAIYKADFKDHLDDLEAGGFKELSRRKVKRKTVWKTVVAGNTILEEAKRIPGKLLPIIPLYAYRSYVDGQEFWYGLVRKMKDANRLFNMSANSIAESAATTSKDMPIFTDEQVEGRETQLAEMHLGKYNYAVINQQYTENGDLIPSGPVGVWAAPRVDPNNAAAMQVSADYIREETGGVPAEALDVEMSGKLFNAMNQRIDLNTFEIMDNISLSLQRSGEVFREMAGEIHDVEQAINVTDSDGTEREDQLFKIIVDEKTGKPKAINDITTGVFEVIVDTGPAFASLKREAVETSKDILAITPPDSPYWPFLYASLIQNMEGPGMDDLKEFNNKQMLLTGLRDPADEDEAAMVQQAQQGQEDEQGKFLKAAAAEAEAEAQESLSNVQKNQTQSGLNQAKAAEIVAGIDISRFKAVTEAQDKRLERQAQINQITFQ